MTDNSNAEKSIEQKLAYEILENTTRWLESKQKGLLTETEYQDAFNSMIDILAGMLSVWRSVDDELPPDEVECVFETNDCWRFVGEFREKRGFIIHKHGYEMIEDIKRWQPINLFEEVHHD